MPTIWMAEVFTPTTIDNLVKGLHSLAPKMERSSFTPSDDIGDWVFSTRRQGRFAYRPVIIVTAKETPIFAGRAVDKLPPGIKYVNLQLQTLSSTVTVLTATFRLDKDSECHLEDILMQDRTAKARRNNNGSFTILDVGRQKADAVDEWRRELRINAAQWIAKRFPGFFCQTAPEQLPTMGLLLTGNYAPWQVRPPRTNVLLEWTDVLDLVSHQGYWQCKGGLPLRLNPATRGDQRHCLTLAALESDLRSRTKSDNGNDRLSQVLWELDMTVPFLLGGWSLSSLLEELEEQIYSIQDTADRVGQGRSTHALEQVQQQLRRIGLDSRIVANDIAQNSDNLLWRRMAPDFTEVPNSLLDKRDSADSLVNVLVGAQTATGNRVVQLEKDLREILSTNADLASATTNLRLQNRVLWLTVISAFAAIIGTAAAVYAIIHSNSPSSPASNHSTVSHSKPATAQTPAPQSQSPTGHTPASRSTRP